jgi:cytochrome o ubiquinol oxidase operon protein cyoD
MKHEATYGSSHGTVTAYVIGFVFSLILTLGAYFLVVHEPAFPLRTVIWEVIGLALVQLLVQLVFFLHLDRESSPRWNLSAFLFALMTVLIIVFGSVWIMRNLDYNTMTAQEIIQDEGIKP